MRRHITVMVLALLSTLFFTWPPAWSADQQWKYLDLVVTGDPDFGIVGINGNPPVHQFTVTNTGYYPLKTNIVFLGNGFRMSSYCGSFSPLLAGRGTTGGDVGESCTLTVEPNTAWAGYFSADLHIYVDSNYGISVPLTATIKTLSITYNGNGNSTGTVPTDSTEYTSGAMAIVQGNSGALTKNGYVFDGWNTMPDGSGVSYAVGSTIPVFADTVLYATWSTPIAPPQGLVSWWRGEGSGEDATGGLTATLTSGMAFTTGKVGQAFKFKGDFGNVPSTSYITVPADARLNFGTSEFSLAAWIKTTDVGIWRRIVTKRSPSASAWYSLGLNGGKVTLEITGTDTVTSTVSVADGQWHHLAVTRDNAGVSPRYYHLYVDGVEVKTLNDRGLNLDNTAPLEMGKWFNENYYDTIFSGVMDEIQIYNRALAASEVLDIYKATAGLAPPPAITGISPASGPTLGGTPVTITGTNLDHASAVTFNSEPATGVTVDSATRVRAVSPAGVAGQVVDIIVTTPGGASAVNSADQFTYIQDQARNVTTGVTYASLTTALLEAQAGAEIRAYDTQVNGNFSLGTGLNLKGGFDKDFAQATGSTILNGNLTLTGGCSTVENILVHGMLTVQEGSLKAVGVTVR